MNTRESGIQSNFDNRYRLGSRDIVPIIETHRLSDLTSLQPHASCYVHGSCNCKRVQYDRDKIVQPVRRGCLDTYEYISQFFDRVVSDTLVTEFP